jgi:glycine/D-amino acid oxidase-like deaminating enzyme
MRFLVVGGGVAGICLTHELLDQHQEVVLFEAGKNVSSSVAAGMINPIVFRRMTLSWRVNEFLPFAVRYYRHLEHKTSATFFHPITIRRLFPSKQERDFWISKQSQPEFESYLQPLTAEDDAYPIEENSFGTGRVHGCGYVNPSTFLNANLEYFKSIDVLREEAFDHSLLDPISLTYKDTSYDYVIFTEGKDGKYNPFFSYLPLQSTKGEVLTIKSSALPSEESLNRKCFLLPLGNDTFKIGSTYVWDTDNTIPTVEGKTQILENFKSISSITPEIVEHKAGVRPTVLDRRPLIGSHPVYPKLIIANGLGAKGYLLAPLVLKEVADHLIHNSPLDPESLIDRFPYHPE